MAVIEFSKVCITCGIARPASMFHKGVNGCRECHKARCKARYLATRRLAPPEHFEKLRLAKIGKKRSPETIRRMTAGRAARRAISKNTAS